LRHNLLRNYQAVNIAYYASELINLKATLAITISASVLTLIRRKNINGAAQMSNN